MAWEHLVKQQGQLATVLAGKAMTRWLNAKAAAKANNYDPKTFASDITNSWSDALDFWFGPWTYGSPLLPTLYINIKALPAIVQLDHDVDATKVVFTACSQIGGTETIAGGANFVFNVVDGATLMVTAITKIPKPSALYLGLAFEGTVPLTTVLVQL